MKMRTLLAGTALVLMAAGPLAAQQATDGAAAPAAGKAVREGPFLPSTVPNALYASELIGMDVYSSETDYAAEYGDRVVEPDARSQWDDIGEINDIVLSPAGDIQGVLVDIGGFLGIGARTVALDMSQLHFLRDETDVSFAAVTSSREALEAAPEYRREMDQTAGVASSDAADTAAPDMAAAPTRPAFEREGFTTADYDQLTADDLDQGPVYDANDENIGSVEELILSQDGKIEQAIVDVGGFLGMGEHRISLDFDEMQVMTNADNSEVRVYIDQTRQTLEQRPEYQQ
jgi:PRC-barrel domain